MVVLARVMAGTREALQIKIKKMKEAILKANVFRN